MPFVHEIDRSLLAPEPCAGLRRVGSPHDGGYVVPVDAILAANRLLSFGVATNWDFERDSLALNPKLAIDAFDPDVGPRRFAELAARSAVSVPLRFVSADPRGALSSLRRLRTALDYFTFFSGRVTHIPKRVWYNTDRGSAAIDDIIASIRRRGDGPVFAKIDIEGSEYRILPWILDHPDLFTGLVVEFHDTDICAALFNAQLSGLREQFMIVHVHGNNYGDVAVDRSLPLSLEISFLHRSLPTRLGPVFKPAELDAPNDPRRPDYDFDFQQPRG